MAEPYVREDGKTVLTNSCGHEYAYNIRKNGAVKWLQGKPCPPCANRQRAEDRKNTPKPQPGSDAPKPQGRPKLGDIERDHPADKHAEDAPAEAQPEPKPGKPGKLPEPIMADVLAALDRLPLDQPFHAVLPDVVALVERNLPVWLQGPPGTSKSTLSQQAAEALGLSFHPVSCHELMTRTDLFGYVDAVGQTHRTPLWEAYENGGLVLLDEVDNGNPNLLAALNSALSNGHCVFGSGSVVPKHADFRVVATANTAGLGPEHGYIGRNGVDLATRDRFVTVDVPVDVNLEDALAALYAGDSDRLTTCVDVARNYATASLKNRSSQSQAAPSVDVLTTAVRALRTEIDARFRGSVVSPRTTIHAAVMTGAGWTLAEALTAKLPGLGEDGRALIAEVVK